MTNTFPLSVMAVLYKLNCHAEKAYCFPSQNKIIKLLKKFHGIDRSVRTLNRWLRIIEDEKYVIRIRRITRDPVYGYMFKSTLYKITRKGYLMLHRAGIDCWDKIKVLFKRADKPKTAKEIQTPEKEGPVKEINKEEMRSTWKKVKEKMSSISMTFFS